MHMRRKFVLLLITALMSFSAFAQEKKPAIVSGSVKDARTKLPLNEAVVTLRSNVFEGEKYALTDETGKYRVGNLPAGTYSISFEMEGYQKYSRDSIVISPGMSLGASFEMVRERKNIKKSNAVAKEN